MVIFTYCFAIYLCKGTYCKLFCVCFKQDCNTFPIKTNNLQIAFYLQFPLLQTLIDKALFICLQSLTA